MAHLCKPGLTASLLTAFAFLALASVAKAQNATPGERYARWQTADATHTVKDGGPVAEPDAPATWQIRPSFPTPEPARSSAIYTPAVFLADMHASALAWERETLATLTDALALPLLGLLPSRGPKAMRPTGFLGTMIWAGEAWEMAPDASDGMALSLANDVVLGGGLSLRPHLNMMMGCYDRPLGGVGGGVTLHLSY